MKLPLSVSHGFQQKSPINELLMINQILLANNGVHNDHTTDELITWEKNLFSIVGYTVSSKHICTCFYINLVLKLFLKKKKPLSLHLFKT